MRNSLSWRRCLTCGQLTLVPVTAEVCWHCGAAMATPRAGVAAASPPRSAEQGGRERRPRFRDLSPADDAVAKRLLASVFPDGVDL